CCYKGLFSNSNGPSVFVLQHTKWDPAQGKFVASPHYATFFDDGNGNYTNPQYAANPGKAANLDPQCFARENEFANSEVAPPALNELAPPPPLPPRDGPAGVTQSAPSFSAEHVVGYEGERPKANLWALDLTWDNTVITLINFDEDGRLESRLLSEETTLATQALRVKTDLDALLSPSSSYLSPINEYKSIQILLSKLDADSFGVGQPMAGTEGNKGFTARDLNSDGVPIEKTPFYAIIDNASYTAEDYNGKVYFYVLLDRQLSFSRGSPALITYEPTPSVGELFTPYKQYPVYPKDAQSGQADVLPIHFYQTHDGSDSVAEGEAPPDCRYPFDFSVIANAQAPFGQVTPLLIDPEVDPKGVLPG
ncbi:MAG: hypothetical protein AAFR74_09140, partial [Pseudomonadota bacterium]